MIAIHDLVKQYGRFTAVDGVTLDVKAGEIHGFLGPNGAGKTTTLRMIAGLLKPTAGRVIVNGHDMATEPEAAKASLGFIPDRPFIYEKLTAGEFLRFHGGLYGINGNAVGARVREMLDLFELGRWENELVESFSHGMKQRLVMSAAFLHRPQAVAVDEPMVGLDPRGARLIKDIFRRMSEHGVAILMSTHTLGSGAGNVSPHQHHPEGARHRAGLGRGGSPDGRRRGRSLDVGISQADRRQRTAGDRRGRLVEVAFPYLLLPHIWASRNRARRRERGDLLRAALFGSIGLAVLAAVFWGSFWVTWQLQAYDELGDYLLRLGLSWLFLTFLAFLTFSGIVTALSTFFLSEDLRLLLVAPVAARRLFHARFARTIVQASWMVVTFMAPVLIGVGVARCARPSFYLDAVLTTVPFVVIPVAVGTGCTLLLVNIFPARRARDLLMLMGLLFAASLVILLRVIRPEQLLRVESLPDVTGFFTALQSPVTPFLPSFWAGELLFTSLRGGYDLVHVAALWTTALAFVQLLRMADERWHFAGYSRAQEAPKARFNQLRLLDALTGVLPMSTVRRQLLVKDLKIFLRDVSQWSQLLLLLALVLVYLYNFRVLDLQRIPYISGFIKNVYAFVNLGMAGFVMATVAVRFVFPAVSAEGAAFWIIRSSPISVEDFLVVEVLDRARTGAAAHRGSDDCRESIPQRRSDAENCRRRCDRVHELRAGGARHGAWREISAFQRGEPEPGRRIVRRRRFHDSCRAAHHGDDRSARLAIVGLLAVSGARRADSTDAPDPDGRLLRGRRGGQLGGLVDWDALGRPRAAGHEQLIRAIGLGGHASHRFPVPRPVKARYSVTRPGRRGHPRGPRPRERPDRRRPARANRPRARAHCRRRPASEPGRLADHRPSQAARDRHHAA